MKSLFLKYLQPRLVDYLNELIVINNLAKINAGQLVNDRFDLFKDRITNFIQSKKEDDSTILAQNVLSQLQCLDFVRHQHEREREEYNIIFLVSQFLNIIKTQLLNGNFVRIFKQLFAGHHIRWVNINSNNI